MTRSKKIITFFFSLAIAIVAFGFLIPERPTIPVQGATNKDWHPKSFWFAPWGRSGVHKGIDIFAKSGKVVLASTDGMVIKVGKNDMGGNYVLMLSAKWRLHYYAHLKTIETHKFELKKAGSKIGTVGNSGNAKGKPPHLHWSIRRIIPLPWKADNSIQGYKKSYFIDPNEWLMAK